MHVPMHVSPLRAASTLALALSAATLAAPAQAAPAELYIDAATHAMPGMPGMGAMGRLAGAMGGQRPSYGMTRHPGMPGRYMDVALHNRAAPGQPATQVVPKGLRLGNSIELLPRERSGGGDNDGGVFGKEVHFQTEADLEAAVTVVLFGLEDARDIVIQLVMGHRPGFDFGVSEGRDHPVVAEAEFGEAGGLGGLNHVVDAIDAVAETAVIMVGDVGHGDGCPVDRR